MKQVHIRIKSVQTADGDRNESELMTEGTFGKEHGVWKISYQESEATGFEGAVTTITADGSRMVNIMRTGVAESHLILEANKPHSCLYGTEYGQFTMRIFTKKIENCLQENGGSLHLKYTIDINSSYSSENEIYLEIIK